MEKELIERIRALAEAQGLSTSTLSAKILGNGKRFAEIEAGGSLTLATYAKAQARLDEMERGQAA